MNLPRLLYIGDVPVEASYHGSALLYRLLQNYPAERLWVVEAGLPTSRPDRRLAGVTYINTLQPGQRWLHTRFHRWVSSAFSLNAPRRSRSVGRAVREIQLEAVLTVAHGFSWMTAAAFARQNRLPLHYIVHDDWPRMVRAVEPVRRWVERQFKQCYREAVSRLCVSPYMEGEYRRLYGAPGQVLYPSRSADCPSYDTPPDRLTEQGRPLVFGFGGTINTGGHALALRELSAALTTIGGQLHLYGPIQSANLEKAGLARANVRLCGLVPASEFIPRMRAEVDVLFVPMSFAAEDRPNMRLCFPSKLTDYTAAGLPLLIYGPEYSSAVQWALTNDGVAEVVFMAGEQHLAKACSALLAPDQRWKLGSKALRVGGEEFSHRRIAETFQRALTGGSP